MGSIDKRPLKAFVRFDGSGRVVAGSLVLRRKKPKVGNWQEITAYECCNPTTTSTTTAATVLPGATYSSAGDAADACALNLNTNIYIEQASVAAVTVGDKLYNDAAGTNPVDGDTLYHKIGLTNATEWNAQIALDGSVLAVNACGA